jgi:hypothetical protein
MKGLAAAAWLKRSHRPSSTCALCTPQGRAADLQGSGPVVLAAAVLAERQAQHPHHGSVMLRTLVPVACTLTNTMCANMRHHKRYTHVRLNSQQLRSLTHQHDARNSCCSTLCTCQAADAATCTHTAT